MPHWGSFVVDICQRPSETQWPCIHLVDIRKLFHAMPKCESSPFLSSAAWPVTMKVSGLMPYKRPSMTHWSCFLVAATQKSFRKMAKCVVSRNNSVLLRNTSVKWLPVLRCYIYNLFLYRTYQQCFLKEYKRLFISDVRSQ